MEQTRQQINMCGNCGKKGHSFRRCSEPILSMGIIAFHLDTNQVDPADSFRIMNKCSSEGHDLSQFFQGCPTTSKKIEVSKDAIRYLMIRRRNTLGFMEFIRGRYQPNNYASVENLFKQMVQSEIDFIATHDFKEIWGYTWIQKTKHNQAEYKIGRSHFNTLKNGVAPLSLESITKTVKPLYQHAEWGFPKGRRNMYEEDIVCAMREFTEETNYTRHDVQLLDKLSPLNEKFEGTNGIPYQHRYFVGHCLFPPKPQIDLSNNEIGDIGWFTLPEALNLIRKRHHRRKQVLKDLNHQLLELLKS